MNTSMDNQAERLKSYGGQTAGDGRLGLSLTALILALTGAGAGAYLASWAMYPLFNLPAPMLMPGRHVLKIGETGTYKVYLEPKLEGAGVQTTRANSFNLSISNTDNGEAVSIEKAAMHERYTMGKRRGYAIYEITIETPGEYAVSASYPSGAEKPLFGIVIARRFIFRAVAGMVVGIGLLVVSLIFGIKGLVPNKTASGKK